MTPAPASPMEEFFSGDALWFTVPAVAGTAFFLLRLLLLAFGGIADADVGGMESDAGVELHHGDSGLAAQFLSIQGITGFFMGFGWSGYAARFGLGWSLGLSFAAAIVGGAAFVLLIGSLFRGVRRLEASGTLNLNEAEGALGEVYVSVPERGRGSGQVRLVLRQRQRIVNAVSAGSALPTRTRVRVASVNPDRTVTVEPI